MDARRIRIGIVATGRSLERAVADKVAALAAAYSGRAELVFHPHCFLNSGHFAGDDSARAQAFLDIANDESYDALWFARGGYGSCRIAADVLAKLAPAARKKTYLGYSDAGTLLAGLYKLGFPQVAHGPMPIDIVRDGGDAAVRRALSWLLDRDPSALEEGVSSAMPTAAFNITILSHLIGTPLQPDLKGHVLLIEEVGEYMYRIDRALCQITASPGVRLAAGIKLGRCCDTTPNDPDFGMSEEQVVQHWCAVSGVPYLGRANIGHDVENRVVPFGRAP